MKCIEAETITGNGLFFSLNYSAVYKNPSHLRYREKMALGKRRINGRFFFYFLDCFFFLYEEWVGGYSRALFDGAIPACVILFSFHFFFVTFRRFSLYFHDTDIPHSIRKYISPHSASQGFFFFVCCSWAKRSAHAMEITHSTVYYYDDD